MLSSVPALGDGETQISFMVRDGRKPRDQPSQAPGLP